MGQGAVELDDRKGKSRDVGPLASDPERLGTLRALLGGARADFGQVSLLSLASRTARRLQALRLGADVARLLNLPIYRAHLDRLGIDDPLFFLAQRHYLTRDLSLTERAEATAFHYLTTADLFAPAGLAAIYHDEGLVLWRADYKAHQYDIRLMGGLDVAHEGAASVALAADGQRVCVMSLSLVPGRLICPTATPGEVAVFVTRKQLTRERGYQRAFFEAFDRSTPAHLVLAAIEGMVQAHGLSRIYGLRAECHPSYAAEIAPHLAAAYSEFWVSLGGTACSSRAYALDVPMQLSAVEDMKPDRRERALARRGHAESIRQSARQVMTQNAAENR
jgi:Protein of unknown function (DUF535)